MISSEPLQPDGTELISTGEKNPQSVAAARVNALVYDWDKKIGKIIYLSDIKPIRRVRAPAFFHLMKGQSYFLQEEGRIFLSDPLTNEMVELPIDAVPQLEAAGFTRKDLFELADSSANDSARRVQLEGSFGDYRHGVFSGYQKELRASLGIVA